MREELCRNELYQFWREQVPASSLSFHSVVVITCPSHGQGRRFDPGWKQGGSLFLTGFPGLLDKA